MQLKQLEYMISLKKTGSITQTANEYFISHQAISKSIIALEIELSTVLLIRSTKGVSLTPAGERFCDFAEKVVNEKRILDNDLLQIRPAPQPPISGSLKIIAVPRYITPSFLHFINTFTSVNKDIQLTVHNATADYIINNVTFDDQTIALLTFGYSIFDKSTTTNIPPGFEAFIATHKLDYQILSEQSLFALVHNKSPVAKKTELTKDEENAIPFVSFSYIFHKDFPTMFTIDSFEQQKNILKNGNSFGRYTQEEIRQFFPKQYHQLNLSDSPKLSFFALFQATPKNPIITLFLEKLCSSVKF